MSLKFISNEEILKIHNKSRELLAEYGLKVKHDKFLQFLAEKSFEVDFKNKVVKIPYELQDKYLKTLPSSYCVSGWDFKNMIEVKNNSDIFFPRSAPGSIFISDYETGKRISAKSSDLINASIILENLDSVKIVSTSISPNDINPKYRDLFAFKTVLQYSKKFIYLQPFSAENLKVMLNMTDVIKEEYSGIKNYPLLNVCISSTSPLKFDEMDINLLYESCNNQIPVLMVAGPILGLTSPISLAGGLVIQHSESMAAFIFAQAIKKGSKILYAPRLAGSDMRTGNIAFSGMEFILITISSIKLAELLKIPVDVVNMLSDSKIPDPQASIEKALGLFMVGQYNPSIMSGIGALEAANTFSLEQAIIDNELVKMFARVRKGFDVNEDTLALNVIKEIGYESKYITHPHTLQNYKKEQEIFDIFDRDFGQSWENKGSKSILDNAHDKVNKILKNNKEPILNSRLISKINNVFKKYIDKF